MLIQGGTVVDPALGPSALRDVRLADGRVAAVGDHIQGYLDGTLRLDHRDSRFRSGQVGLWTKADSVTAFDDLVIRGVPGTGGG